MRPLEIQAFLEAEERRGLFTLELAEHMKSFLENIFAGLNHLMVSIKNGKTSGVDADDKINDIFHNLDLAMESVISISRIAASSPAQLNNYIETSQADINSLMKHVDMGHFAKLIQKFKEVKSTRPLSAPESNANNRNNNNGTDIERSISDESEASSISIQQHNIMKKSKFVVDSYFQPSAAPALKQQKCKVCKCVVPEIVPGDKSPLSRGTSFSSLLGTARKPERNNVRKLVRTIDQHCQVKPADIIPPICSTTKAFYMVWLPPTRRRSSTTRNSVAAHAASVAKNIVESKYSESQPTKYPVRLSVKAKGGKERKSKTDSKYEEEEDRKEEDPPTEDPADTVDAFVPLSDHLAMAMAAAAAAMETREVEARTSPHESTAPTAGERPPLAKDASRKRGGDTARSRPTSALPPRPTSSTVKTSARGTDKSRKSSARPPTPNLEPIKASEGSLREEEEEVHHIGESAKDKVSAECDILWYIFVLNTY